MQDIFLSYSRDDQAIARLFAEGFERVGFSVWWDVTLKSGEDYDKVTENALRAARAVVVLWSKKSVESRWVRAEATEADSLGTLVPVMIEPCKRPIMFELKQSADLVHWKGDESDKAWLALVSDLRSKVAVEHGEQSSAVRARHAVPLRASREHESSTLSQHPADLHSNKQLTYFLIAVVAALLAFVVLQAVLTPDATTTADNAVAVAEANNTQAQVAVAERSIAILPFANLSPDPDQEYFADGLTDELINSLANVQGLLVTARASAFYFKGKDTPLMEIGEMLGVAYILQGSVRKAADDLRITVQLTDVTSGFSLWSNIYDISLNDIFAVQNEIASNVTTALSITLGAGTFDQPGMTRNVKAYDEYLQGRLALNMQTVESMPVAIAHAENAVKLDPQFALGWNLLAGAYNNSLGILPAEQTSGMEESLRNARARVRALAPTSTVAFLTQFNELAGSNDYLGAEKLVDANQDALAGTAVLIDARRRLLRLVGRERESLAYARRAALHDPLSVDTSLNLALALMASSEPADAVRQEIARSMSLSKDNQRLVNLYGNLAFVEMSEDQWDAALAATEHLTATRDAQTTLLNFMKRGDNTGGLAEIRRLMNDEAALPPLLRVKHLPVFAALFGDPAYALQLLQAAQFIGDAGIPDVLWSSFFKDMRKLPEFKSWMQSLGLVTYWRTTGQWADLCHPVGADDFECE